MYKYGYGSACWVLMKTDIIQVVYIVKFNVKIFKLVAEWGWAVYFWVGKAKPPQPMPGSINRNVQGIYWPRWFSDWSEYMDVVVPYPGTSKFGLRRGRQIVLEGFELPDVLVSNSQLWHLILPAICLDKAGVWTTNPHWPRCTEEQFPDTADTTEDCPWAAGRIYGKLLSACCSYSAAMQWVHEYSVGISVTAHAAS